MIDQLKLTIISSLVFIRVWQSSLMTIQEAGWLIHLFFFFLSPKTSQTRMDHVNTSWRFVTDQNFAKHLFYFLLQTTDYKFCCCCCCCCCCRRWILFWLNHNSEVYMARMCSMKIFYGRFPVQGFQEDFFGLKESFPLINSDHILRSPWKKYKQKKNEWVIQRQWELFEIVLWLVKAHWKKPRKL
jgi:hypothetical protein